MLGRANSIMKPFRDGDRGCDTVPEWRVLPRQQHVL